MADHGLNGGAPLDRGRDASQLALTVNLEFALLLCVVSFIAGVGKDAGQRCPSQRFDAGQNRFQRVPIIEMAGQSLCVEDELRPAYPCLMVSAL
jgi:hypothetical protein